MSENEINDLIEKGKGPLKKVVIEMENGDKKPYIMRLPNRKEKYAIVEVAQSGKVERSNDLFINTCIVAGDMELVRTDDDVMEELQNQIEAFKAEQKKVKSVSSETLA